MKFNAYEKDRLAIFVAAQFSTLAGELGSQGRAQAVLKVFRDQIQPRLEEWKKADPDLYKRLELVSYVVGGSNERFEISPAIPLLSGISSETSGSWGQHPKNIWITEQLILQNLPDEAKINGERAMMLKEQAKKSKELLAEYLKDFTNPAQLSFSFPQLHTMYCMSVDKNVKPQKRPKVFKRPPEELKTLVLQSMVLAQAKGRS